MFGESVRAEWAELAAAARREIAIGRGSVGDPPSPAAQRAMARLMVTIGRQVGMRHADFAVTRWLIIDDEPIEAAVAAEVAADRPYQSGGPQAGGPFADALREAIAELGPVTR